MAKKNLFGGLWVLALIAVICLACNGKKANAAENGGGSALADVKKEIAEHGGLLWEDTVTETTATNAAGHISRGKTNLKITGTVNPDDLTTIGNSINAAFKKETRLFKLDFSSANFELRDAGTFRCPSNGIGSLTLPKGIKEILQEGIFIIEVNLPSTESGTEDLHLIGAFTKVIVAPDVRKISISSINNFAAILYEGRKSIELHPGLDETFSYFKGWSWRKQNARYCLVFPSTLTEFSEYTRTCEEIYSYAATPPVASDGGSGQFSDVKTVYVPAGSEKAYEEAWFNYTSAEIKPHPKNMQTVDQFIQNWRPAKNNLGITVERNDK